MIKKVKKTCTYVISDLNGKEILEASCDNDMQKNQEEFRVEKVIKRNGDKIYDK